MDEDFIPKIVLIVIVVVLAVAGIIWYFGRDLSPKPLGPAKTGEVVEVDIQSPHPYPNGDFSEKRSLVWSDVLSHPGAASLRLHFDRFEIKYGKFTAPTVSEIVDYGPCEQSSKPEPQTDQQSGEISVGELVIPKPCGLVEEKREYTPQEIFDNNWITGDFLLVKDEEGNILEILTKSPFFLQNQHDFWSHTYSGFDTLTLELYADSADNDFGVSIDKYSRGFTKEEFEENPILPAGENIIVTGTVVKNDSAYIVDGYGILTLSTPQGLLEIIYDFGRSFDPDTGGFQTCINKEANKKGKEAKIGQKIEVFGKVINGNTISPCDSQDFYIK